MSADSIKWLLCVLIIALGCPLGVLVSDLSGLRAAGVIAIVLLICFLSYLMGSL